MNEPFDKIVDFVVVGSGAAGMSAALAAKVEGLDTLVVEKCEYYGGSSAISGGGIWVPNNHLMKEAGIEDSEENVRTYFKHTVGDRTPQENQQAFIKYAPRMLKAFSKLPYMEFQIAPEFCDYYPERPGGTKMGRGVEATLFEGKSLGEIFSQLRIRPIKLPFDFVITMEEGRKLTLIRTNPVFMQLAIKAFIRNLYDKLFQRHHVAMGGALIARLRMSLYEQDVPVWLNTPVNKIIFDDSRAMGLELEKDGKPYRIKAEKGIVLAAGGFPLNKTMRETYHGTAEAIKWTSASPGNTGEIIQMGIEAGAKTDLLDDTWGMPMFLPPGEHPVPIVLERSYPGAIMVNSQGKRFTKECASYVDVAHEMHKQIDYSDNTSPKCCYMIIDKDFRSKYVLGTLMPGHMPRKYFDHEVVYKADSLDALAEKANINVEDLKETVSHFNKMVGEGRDREFGRGESAYDRFYSDKSVKPNCCMGYIRKPPFYAVKLYPGDIGTKGGLVTNENAQVINTSGEVIQGLYAAGNTSASVMGNTYPGPGSTLGPAMTFGYIAAQHAAGTLEKEDTDNVEQQFGNVDGQFDETVDLLVIGSGAAGMTAALTASHEGLKSLLVEKCEFYGGTTAISGGGIWIPNNHLMNEKGLIDSKENVRTYMQNTVGDSSPKEVQEAFIKYAPEMLEYLSKLPHMKFKISEGFCDYYPERPGGAQEGRGVEAEIFSGEKLGGLFYTIRSRIFRAPMDAVVTIDEGKKLSLLFANPQYMGVALSFFVRNIVNFTFAQKHIAMGGALIARLRMSLYEHHVHLWLNTSLKEFIFDGDSIVGAIVEREGKTIRIKANKGIVLAAGGFAKNHAMREKYHQKPVNVAWSSASPGNTGEVMQMGIDCGAAVDLMDDTWGMPMFCLSQQHPLPIVLERSYPGSIIVNAAGERFINESSPYVDVVHTMYKLNSDSAPSLPSFFIMDSRNRNKYMFTTILPGYTPRSLKEHGDIIKADTLEELAQKMGIDEAGLMKTIERFNQFARHGEDQDFGRGNSAYDRFYGDPATQPNPCIGPVEQPPFYGIRLYPGDIDTKGGLVTNGNAQVLNKKNEWIKGLYAAGNNMASVMGNTYPGPGSTIGPAMTFGYIAAKHAAGKL